MKEMLSLTLVGFLASGVLLPLLTGCRSMLEEPPMAVNFTENTWAAPAIPEGVRRVVVLPVSITLPTSNVTVASLWRDRAMIALNGELSKTNRFEVLQASAATLSRWGGRNAPGVSSELPADFLSSISFADGADAVMLAELAMAKDFPPFAASWKVRLVSVRDGSIIWACDNFFDGDDRATQQAAQIYSGEKMVSAKGQAPYPTILQSSQGFLRFTLAMIFPSLPLHSKQIPAGTELSTHADAQAVSLAAYPKSNSTTSTRSNSSTLVSQEHMP